ncbi:MAG: hypothetical protein WBO23_11510 [Burkholderiales bacterium]
MTPSVSPEADWELTEGAVFYAREGNAEVGLAFILEYERAVALLCDHPYLGALEEWSTPLPAAEIPYSIVYDVRGETLRVMTG